jgi:uncharacterized protein (TIGR02145 family)
MLYSVPAVINSNTICPTGWSLPDQAAMSDLISSAGNDASKLRSADLWLGATEGNVGFNALPGGYMDDNGLNDARFYSAATSLPATGGMAAFMGLGYKYLTISQSSVNIMPVWFGPAGGGSAYANKTSIRCVKN